MYDASHENIPLKFTWVHFTLFGGRTLADYVIKIDQHVANISGLLSGNVEELQEIVGELVTVSKQFKDAPRNR